MMLLGAAILAFGMFNVHRQNAITEGGVLGMTLLVEHWTGVSPAVSEIVLDVICYGLGARFLGRGFLGHALATTLAYSGFFAVFERLGYLLPSLRHAPLLAALAGALFIGLGAGLVVRAGSAASGDDALAQVIAGRTGCSISRAYLGMDLSVLALSTSYIPLGNIACSLVTVTLSSFLVGQVVAFGKKGGKDGK